MHELPTRPPPPRSLPATVGEWLRWVGLARLVVGAMAVVAVAAGGFWLLRAPPTPVESALPYASATTTSTTVASLAAAVADVGPATTTTGVPLPSHVVVYVAGAVLVPAVYELPIGARVTDAITAAGGLTADADADVLNLAAAVRDGDRVFVPRVGQPVPVAVNPTGGGRASAGSADRATASDPVDLNTATVEALDALPGVGPSTAAAIVAHRERDGPFLTVDDLLDVRGIGPAKLDAIRELVTV